MSMTPQSEKRRSGVWQTDMFADRNRLQRAREPTMYDEWLTQEKNHNGAQQVPRRRPSMPLLQSNCNSSRSDDTATGPMTPDGDQSRADVGMESNNADLSANHSTRFERVLFHHTTTTTTTIVNGTTPRDRSGSSSKSKMRSKDRRKEDTTSRSDHSSSHPNLRSGIINMRTSSLLRRSGDGSNGQDREQRPQTSGTVEANTPSYPRTRTLDGRSHREHTPTNRLPKSRNRKGSLHLSGSPTRRNGTDPRTVPAATIPIVSSDHSLSSSDQAPLEAISNRSISPQSYSTTGSMTSALPSANARRILHLMKMLDGRMSGNVIFRRGFGNPWAQSYCYINEESGSLMYESRASQGGHKTLVADLRGAIVRSNLDGDIAYLEVALPQSLGEVHIKLQTQSEFDAWFAALLHWQPRDDRSAANGERRPESEAGPNVSTTAVPSNRRASLNNPDDGTGRDRAASSRSTRSDRRKSVIPTPPKENPVIKIGKMIFWDTNVSPTNASVGQPSSRPSNTRMHSVGTRRWRRISGQLRENGELKLHSDADNSLLSVVQLSQLSRCAIQRLDSSVLENDFCIAIYPQYTSSYTNHETDLVRPIFLSLETRVLYEVWFVLLRAFTLPSIYGPRLDVNSVESSDHNVTPDLESMIATSAAYTFRMERSLNVRIVEAKIKGSTSSSLNTGFNGGHSKRQSSDRSGYYAEVQLDNEIRGKTVVKYEGTNPLWGESFEFHDLPPVLSNASIVLRKRSAEQASFQQQDNKQVSDALVEQQGGLTNLAFDTTCGKVAIRIEELEPEKEIEKWWPVANMHGQHVGDILLKVRADEGIVLMAHDYQPLNDLLHDFGNGLTLQIAQMIPSELKRLSDSLLNIFQVSGKAGDWLMSLIEEEIDGVRKETPVSKLRLGRRAGSNENDPHGSGAGNSDRELIVRDIHKNATVEANLLFRGNTLLTKSLDTHMRRVGREYLEETLATTMQDINEQDLECEVDPNKAASPEDLQRNWKRLISCTEEVWKAIVASKARCPVELRIIFRHIRACAEERYGNHIRSVSFSSVSGFLFLRFFCPAVLNPKIFGLLKDDMKLKARRTFTLIAKSLQTMVNMASFGTKEPWMEPMNAFLVQHRESFKSFIDDICYVPAPPSTTKYGPNAGSSAFQSGIVSSEQHLSYTTPMTIMHRLPPSSREGFPSLPYLIDQARSFAEIIPLWLDAVKALSRTGSSTAPPARTHVDVLAAIEASKGDLQAFHLVCEDLNARTQECLNRAERAERPDTPHSFRFEEIIDQLHKTDVKEPIASQDMFDIMTDKIATDPKMLREDVNPTIEATMAELRGQIEAEAQDTVYRVNPLGSDSIMAMSDSSWQRPGSASVSSSLQGGSFHQNPYGSANISNVSSTVSSDTEHSTGTTALPSYDREIKHRERREAARLQIQKQMEAARLKDLNKEKKKMNKLVPALRKKHKLEREGVSRDSGPPPDGMI